ncbi:hypothetical protein FC85_GL002407 [Lentilactobacillus diolivorans DSM 14421]|uniref:DUF5776 domain-containing protein n=1 Tax=Lentilactobacillus diolivorans DSM 14421 TaxID=1423739 RepID=A0A0R1SJ51_9LACO|nr:hypothetical protein FC85_GL002407 [Lentilactobacillus diolivorans DSM 14421]
MIPFFSTYQKSGSLFIQSVYADSNEQDETQDSHSNNSVTNPVNWNNWQKNPLLNFNFDDDLNMVEGNENIQDILSIDAAWASTGDTEAEASISDDVTFYHYLVLASTKDIASLPATLGNIAIDGTLIPNSDIKLNQFSAGKSLGTSFSFPLKKYMVNPVSISTKSENKDNHIQSTIRIRYIDPNHLKASSGTLNENYLNNDYLSVTDPQIVRIFYKDSKTGDDIAKPTVLGENKSYQYELGDIKAPEIKGYTLKTANSIEYQTATVSKEKIIDALNSAIKNIPGVNINDSEIKTMSEEYDQLFGKIPTRSLLNYIDLSKAFSLGIGTKDPNAGLNFSLALYELIQSSDKPFSVYNYLQNGTTKYRNGNVIRDIKLDTIPQAITFWYNKDSPTSTTPATPSTTNTSAVPNDSTSSTTSNSSSSSTSSTSPSTPTPSSSSSSSNNTSLPSYAAAKGTVVYPINKIGLYKSTKFSATKRSAWYTKKPRVYRPMFVVTGYKRSDNGALKYRVQDVNHTSKTNGKTGYITASQKYVCPVYYAAKHSTVTVINPRGVNAYRKANLTKKARNYRQGTVLHVKRIVSHNLTTRYVLTNGDYITANRKLVNMGRHQQVKSVKTKRTVNRYSNANFTKKNHAIAKNRALKVYGYDYSQSNNVTKHGVLRYRVAGGYITANTKYVRAYK